MECVHIDFLRPLPKTAAGKGTHTHGVPVTHRSTVARTNMCRQDGRGRFPVLLDDLSKCRTNSQKENPNLVRIRNKGLV